MTSALARWAERKLAKPRFAGREGKVQVEISVTNAKGTTFKRMAWKTPAEAKKLVDSGKAKHVEDPGLISAEEKAAIAKMQADHIPTRPGTASRMQAYAKKEAARRARDQKIVDMKNAARRRLEG